MSNSRDYLGLGQQGAKVPVPYLVTIFIVAAIVWTVVGAIWNGTAGLVGFIVVFVAGLGVFALLRRNASA